MLRPGCGGFFIGIGVLLFLVVVDQFNVECVGSFKTKHDTPVGPHGYGPKPLQIAFQRVQTITGKIKRLRRIRLIETGKKIFNRVHQIRPNPPAVAAFIEAF